MRRPTQDNKPAAARAQAVAVWFVAMLLVACSVTSCRTGPAQGASADSRCRLPDLPASWPLAPRQRTLTGAAMDGGFGEQRHLEITVDVSDPPEPNIRLNEEIVVALDGRGSLLVELLHVRASPELLTGGGQLYDTAAIVVLDASMRDTAATLVQLVGFAGPCTPISVERIEIGSKAEIIRVHLPHY